MEKRNLIIISLDEVRPDHLSCYGYTKTNTPNIDKITKEGVKFETCISSSALTPIAMGSVITGKYPNKHGMRDPYCYIAGPSIAEILKENGYITAGFVGNGLLSKNRGFAERFDFWNEPSEDTSWFEIQYPGFESKGIMYEGNYWVEEFFNWLEKNYRERLFVWGHLYETHEGSQYSLLKKGLIREGELTEFGYYDAKIKMADEKLISRLAKTLDELDISENTTLVIMSDHGTNLGEHPADPVPWRPGEVRYPQHTSMYDHDLKVAMIIKGEGFPKGKHVKGMVRSIDLIPTLLDSIGISSEEYDFDGSSLLPVLKQGKAGGREVYSEDLFEARGKGALQSIRADSFKFIRNLTLGTEEYYDLSKDPGEHNNIVDRIDKQAIVNLRKRLNAFLKTEVSTGKILSKQEKDDIDQRLRGLGYIK
jgi:arylsulfatase A-like enzyme